MSENLTLSVFRYDTLKLMNSQLHAYLNEKDGNVKKLSKYLYLSKRFEYTLHSVWTVAENAVKILSRYLLKLGIVILNDSPKLVFWFIWLCTKSSIHNRCELCEITLTKLDVGKGFIYVLAIATMLAYLFIVCLVKLSMLMLVQKYLLCSVIYLVVSHLTICYFTSQLLVNIFLSNATLRINTNTIISILRREQSMFYTNSRMIHFLEEIGQESKLSVRSLKHLIYSNLTELQSIVSRDTLRHSQDYAVRNSYDVKLQELEELSDEIFDLDLKNFALSSITKISEITECSNFVDVDELLKLFLESSISFLKLPLKLLLLQIKLDEYKRTLHQLLKIWSVDFIQNLSAVNDNSFDAKNDNNPENARICAESIPLIAYSNVAKSLQIIREDLKIQLKYVLKLEKELLSPSFRSLIYFEKSDEALKLLSISLQSYIKNVHKFNFANDVDSMGRSVDLNSILTYLSNEVSSDSSCQMSLIHDIKVLIDNLNMKTHYENLSEVKSTSATGELVENQNSTEEIAQYHLSVQNENSLEYLSDQYNNVNDHSVNYSNHGSEDRNVVNVYTGITDNFHLLNRIVDGEKVSDSYNLSEDLMKELQCTIKQVEKSFIEIVVTPNNDLIVDETSRSNNDEVAFTSEKLKGHLSTCRLKSSLNVMNELKFSFSQPNNLSEVDIYEEN